MRNWLKAEPLSRGEIPIPMENDRDSGISIPNGMDVPVSDLVLGLGLGESHMGLKLLFFPRKEACVRWCLCCVALP